MSVQEDLKQFYDAEAVKYANTREKHRSEADIFLDEIGANEKKTLKILEFGCGGWRLLKHLAMMKNKKIEYIWVDISPELLKIAKKQIPATNKYITCTWVCDDILNVVKLYKQETFDYIIGIASFQHIPSKKERFYLMKNFYRLLTYEGKLMMVNWSFSVWFLKKYQSNIVKAFFKCIITRGKKDRKDILVPRKSKSTIHQRFYHIFTLGELRNLHILSWFLTRALYYLDTKWQETKQRQTSKSTLLIAEKNVRYSETP